MIKKNKIKKRVSRYPFNLRPGPRIPGIRATRREHRKPEGNSCKDEGKDQQFALAKEFYLIHGFTSLLGCWCSQKSIYKLPSSDLNAQKSIMVVGNCLSKVI